MHEQKTHVPKDFKMTFQNGMEAPKSLGILEIFPSEM